MSRAIATNTSQAGSTGGTWIAIKSHMSWKRSVVAQRLHEKAFPTTGRQWTAVLLRCVPFDVLLVVVYMETSAHHTLTPGNKSNLEFLTELVRAHRTPFLIAGDWNMEPATLINTGFVHNVGGQARSDWAADLQHRKRGTS